jgi:hypothetical protein
VSYRCRRLCLLMLVCLCRVARPPLPHAMACGAVASDAARAGCLRLSIQHKQFTEINKNSTLELDDTGVACSNSLLLKSGFRLGLLQHLCTHANLANSHTTMCLCFSCFHQESIVEHDQHAPSPGYTDTTAAAAAVAAVTPPQGLPPAPFHQRQAQATSALPQPHRSQPHYP